MKNRRFCAFLCLLGFCVALPCFADKTDFYSVRPHIQDVPARAGKIKNSDWEKTKYGFMKFLASLYFYPDNYHFFFAERDFETAEDMAFDLFQDPSFRDRFHQFNVSRDSYKNPNLWNYLAAVGMNNDDPNRRFLILDTGMLGTIPDWVRDTAPTELKGRIQAHHFLSVNPNYPSSRVFLSTMEPKAISGPVAQWEPIILLFENIPHFTYTVVDYKINPKTGKWEALTGPKYRPPNLQMGGMDFGFGGNFLEEKEPKHPKEALEYMADIRAYAKEKSTQQKFYELSKIWYGLGVAYRKSVLSGDKSYFQSALEDLRAHNPKNIEIDAIIRDVQEIVKINKPYEEVDEKRKTSTESASSYAKKLKTPTKPCLRALREAKT